MDEIDERALAHRLLQLSGKDAIDPHRLTVAYDRASDILMVYFRGRGTPTVSIPMGDDQRDWFSLLYDRAHDAIVGLQIENFLAFYVRERPIALDFLTIAELRGITPEEVDRLRSERGTDTYKRELVGQLLGDLVVSTAD